MDAYYRANGFKVAKNNGTGTFVIRTKPNATAMPEGTYKVKVTVKGDNLSDDFEFTVTAKVTASPVITMTDLGSMSEVDPNAINYGATLNGTGHFFSAGTDYNYDFEVEDVEGSDMTIAQSGFTFTSTPTSSPSKLIVTGKNKKAGTLKVKVTATAQGHPDITAWKVFDIVIAAEANFTATIGGVTVASANDGFDKKVYVLDGIEKDETGDSDKTYTLTLTNGSEAAAKGLKVIVENAEDDRDPEVRAKSDIRNIYESRNSVEMIEIAQPSIKDVPKSQNIPTTITAHANRAGEFKVKVTVTGDNVIKRTFYLYQVVGDNLTLTAPANPVAKVGTETYLEVTASGTDQDITWTEVVSDAKNALPTTEANSAIKKAGFTGFGVLAGNGGDVINLPEKNDINKYTTKLIRSLVIHGDDKAITEALKDADNHITGYEIIDYNEAAPTNKGNYKIYLKATTAASALDTATHIDKLNYIHNTASAVPAQTGRTSINLTVNPTKAVNVKNVTSTPQSVVANAYDYKTGMTDADISGIISSDVRAYSLKPAAVIDPGQEFDSILVGILNDSDADITNTKFRLGTNNFVVKTGDEADGDIIDDGNVTVTAATTTTPASGTLAAAKTNYIKITPKATLTAGIYTDTLSIENNNLEKPVKLQLTFVVEPKTYLLDADFLANAAKAPDTAVTQDKEYKAAVKDGTLTNVVTASVVNAGKKVELSPFKAGGTASNVDILFIRNTGNTEIPANAVTAVEVDANGNEISDTSAVKLVIANAGSATPATIGQTTVRNAMALPEVNAITGEVIDYHEDFIAIKPYNANKLAAGEYDAYLKISVADATPASFIVPVHFVVFNSDLTNITATPTATTVALSTVSEGYKAANVTGGEFTIRNDYTGGEINSLYDLSISLGSPNFKVLADDKDNITGSGQAYKIKKIAPGETVSFKVVPIDGLPAEDYETSVVISGGNLATVKAVRKNLTLTVEKSMAFTADVYDIADVSYADAVDEKNKIVVPNTIDPKFAKRLFTTIGQLNTNSSKYLKTRGENVGEAITIGEVGYTNKWTATLDLDLNDTADTIVTFRGDSTIATVDDVDYVEINRVHTVKMPNGSYTVPDITSTSPSYDGFTSLTFNEYSVITFEAVTDYEYLDGVVGTYEKNNDLIRVVGNVGTDDKSIAANTEKHITGNNGTDVATNKYIGFNDNGTDKRTLAKANEALKVLVQNGQLAATSFTAGLPTVTYYNGTESFEGWYAAGTKKTVDDRTYVAGDEKYSALWHGHNYPGSTTGDSDHVKWNWNANHTQATVTVTCMKSDCPDANKGAITLDSSKGEIVIVDKKKEADCEHGERHEYTATSIARFMPNGAVYTSVVNVGEDPSTIKGHKYQPTVTWTYNETTKEYEPSIKLVCTVCAETDTTMQYHEVTVPASDITYTTNRTKEPTCTAIGAAEYEITGFTAVGKAYKPSDFSTFTLTEWKKIVDLPALGHDYKLEIEWNDNHETAKTAELVCQRPNCAETEEGHKVNVIESVTYTITRNDDGTVGKNVAKVLYNDKEYTEEWVDDVLYNPQVEWIDTFPLKWYKDTAYPTMRYNVVVTSKKKGTQITISGNSAVVTSDPDTIPDNALEATFTATADLSKYFADATGETRAQNVTKSEKYFFKDGGKEGISDVYYNPEVEWTTTFPAKWTKKTDYPTMTYKVTYTSKRTGEKTTLSGNTAVVTSDPASIPDTATEATFIATADLSAYYTDATGTTPAQNATLSQKYVFPNGQAEGYARDYKYKSHNFTWPTKTEPMATPNVKVKVTYSVTENKKTLPDETISGNAIMSDGTISGNYISFTAKVNTFDGLTKSETKKYNIKTGKLYEGQETPAEPEQPENKTSVNLFYTNADKEIISLQLPDGADVKGGSGKWTTYYDIDESGTVTVKAPAKDLSKAASASNSVITIPVKSDSGNEIGQFSYSLPVYYQKPKLKLTSTSGTVNTAKGGETTLVTTVTEKKSSGAFEKMSLDNLADDGLKYNAKSGSVVIGVGDEVGEITLTTSAKASGKISIQLENWVEPMELSYTVKATNKNVLTSDKKQVIFNLNSYDDTGANPDSQSIELFVNGEPAEAGALTLVKMPNGWDASGLKVADGCIDESSKQLTDSTLTFEYSGTKPANKSKTYSFQFKTSDNKKITVKAQMSKLALANKALTYKTQTKMNLSTGQRMVLIPQFKGVTGEYEDVKLASGDEKTFELEPDYERGQVYLAPADGVTLSSKTQYTPTIEATVGGVPVTTQLKFKPQQSNVTVKIDKVTVPKTKMEDGTMEAEANVLCTYKQGGKTFTTAPNRQGDTDAVTFMIDNKTKAPAVGGEELGKLGLTDGWYKIDKANVLVKYEASTGTILVRPTGKVVKPKNGSVKVWLNFNGKIVKKTLNVKIDKTK